jgi:large subunit ribosomal protein L25
MKTIEINGSLRKELGKKSSKDLRKAKNVPCVLYGGKENLHFYSHENNFTKLIYTHESHLVKLNIEGSEIECVLKEVQFHPVTDKIIHLDFIEVFKDKPILVNLPVTVTGDSVGIKAGGKLRIRKRSLLVKGLAQDIPDFLPIDISDLKIHESVKVADLSYDKIELVDPKRLMVLSIATSRVAQKTEEEIEAEEAHEGAVPATEEASEGES